MDQEQQLTRGRCLCGAIRFEVIGPELGAGYCHCESCRRQTGAPVAAYVVFEAAQVTWQGQARMRYASSPGRFRSFCGTCGASLGFEDDRRARPLIELHISTLDRPEDFPPREHTHYAEKIEWVECGAGLKTYPGGLPGV